MGRRDGNRKNSSLHVDSRGKPSHGQWCGRKTHFRHKNEEEDGVQMPSTRQSLLRRVHIRKEDVSKERYGLTVGRKFCEAASRGTT